MISKYIPLNAGHEPLADPPSQQDSRMRKPSEALQDEHSASPGYFGYRDVVSYILGITFEIWEQRQVDTIRDYYGKDIEVYSLEGITRGSEAMVRGTRATLEAFPDRLLLGDDIIWSGNLERGFSSHRITSPMTNRGDTLFAPATGRSVQTMNIADCEITNGQITGEWLFRDNLALVRQLGVDPADAARKLASRFDDNLRNWMAAESERVVAGRPATAPCLGEDRPDENEALARRILQSCWQGGGSGALDRIYEPYAVLHRAPVRIFSGREALLDHYAGFRNAFPDAQLTVDHVCSQPFGREGCHVAARWSVAAHQQGPYAGMAPQGNPVYIVGVSHWRLINGRVVVEWTVFDELSLQAQLLTETD
jgi:predicted ester cyclase